MLLGLNRGEKGGNGERILIQTGVMDGSHQGWGDSLRLAPTLGTVHI